MWYNSKLHNTFCSHALTCQMVHCSESIKCDLLTLSVMLWPLRVRNMQYKMFHRLILAKEIMCECILLVIQKSIQKVLLLGLEAKLGK